MASYLLVRSTSSVQLTTLHLALRPDRELSGDFVDGTSSNQTLEWDMRTLEKLRLRRELWLNWTNKGTIRARCGKTTDSDSSIEKSLLHPTRFKLEDDPCWNLQSNRTMTFDSNSRTIKGPFSSQNFLVKIFCLPFEHIHEILNMDKIKN